MTAGTLYLVPNTLGEGDESMLAAVLPAAVQARAGTLGYYIGENAKTTRAFLRRSVRRGRSRKSRSAS